MVLFSWSGKGYMVPVWASLSTLGLMGLAVLLRVEVQDEVITAVAALLSSAGILRLHHRLKHQATSLHIVDEESGESTPLKTKHDFCLFPLWFWGLLFGAVGLYCATALLFPDVPTQINHFLNALIPE